MEPRDPRAGKVCPRCKWWKLFDQFHHNAANSDDRQSWCKSCRSMPGVEHGSLFEKSRREKEAQIRERRLPMLRSVLARMRELGHMGSVE